MTKKYFWDNFSTEMDEQECDICLGYWENGNFLIIKQIYYHWKDGLVEKQVIICEKCFMEENE